MSDSTSYVWPDIMQLSRDDGSVESEEFDWLVCPDQYDSNVMDDSPEASDLACKNDDMSPSKAKESFIKETFAAHGCKVKFVG